METPFEEVLERAKAGDPKAQTEVRRRCLVGGSGRGPQDGRPGRELWPWGSVLCGPACVRRGDAAVCLAPCCVSLCARSFLPPLSGVHTTLLCPAHTCPCPTPFSLLLGSGCHTLLMSVRSGCLEGRSHRPSVVQMPVGPRSCNLVSWPG